MNRSSIVRAVWAVRSRAPLAMLCALLLAVPAPGQGASDDEDPTAQLSKLQTLLFAYADKYMSAIAQVTFEAQKRDPTDPELRLRMHSLKLLVTASVQQLAVSANPESTLLDMMGGVFDRVMWTGTILILILCVAVFVTMLIYRAAARHIVARSSFEYVGPPPNVEKGQL